MISRVGESEVIEIEYEVITPAHTWVGTIRCAVLALREAYDTQK